jgi:2,3-bisphosphoglycerate-dependent phosphoglycerate mutase
MASGKLVLVRHGESEWNLVSRWTGWTDMSITAKGATDARAMGQVLSDIHFDKIYTSNLKRSVETMENLLETQGQRGFDYQPIVAMNERDYGDYTGLNKWEVKNKLGEDKFNAIRRNFDEPIPGGETLHDVYNRAVPWYQKTVVPQLMNGKNILVVAHGNSIRALVKYIESMSDADIAGFEMAFGLVLIYTVDAAGREVSKEVRQIEITPTAA